MLWKNRWDVGAFSAKLSQGDGPPPHNPPPAPFFFLFFLPCKTDLTNDLRGWQVGVARGG